jgi:hypothetical protein
MGGIKGKSGLKPRPLTWKEAENGCWICTSHHRCIGYPCIVINGEKTVISHIYYEKYKGSIKPGLIICHHCDNPNCINPDHLFQGTKLDNRLDMIKKNRQVYASGEMNGKAKLSEQQVMEIKNSKESIKNLQYKYGMSKTQIYSIIRGDTWRHLCP